MTALSHSGGSQNEAWFAVFKQEGEYIQWHRILQEFMRSVALMPGRTLADLRKGLKERLKWEQDEKKVDWIVVAYAALTVILDEGILALSATIHELEAYLGWKTAPFVSCGTC